MTELTKLVKMRGTIKTVLTRFINFLNDSDAKTGYGRIDFIRLEKCRHVGNYLKILDQLAIESFYYKLMIKPTNS